MGLNKNVVNVVGAGLAGSELAYQLAKNNINVKLYEMRPIKMTDAHKTNNFAELVCSNSLRSTDITNAVGLLKYEMAEFGSLIIEAANYASIPAGGSLAVDRDIFSSYISNKISNHPNIEIIREEVTKINLDEYTVIAAGPLASDKLFDEIKQLLNQEHLHFFDAIAPIIERDSINMDVCYIKNRYDKGEAAYINCPMDEEEYNKFYEELINAKKAAPKDFEKNVFEGCMPVEAMASRGQKTLLFGPLKPVGLEKEDGSRPHAVVQLRQDDASKKMYNIVGFQTSLTWGEQKRIINLIPGLEKANIIRYGVIHRNTYIESPEVLNSSFQVKNYPKLFFAGQISGVEGYVESAASGINVAVQLVNLINNNELKPLPKETIMGSMSHYISTPNKSFAPINANFGIIPELNFKHKKKERKELYVKRAKEALEQFKDELTWII
ncbi:MAG TPA: methylenetetrahydrofolate--tRNA-(uracil(54)-C(5))-methyltransferase (FADH(2)-oxidizing) TrmFO [Acholeplasmataceae bacterium]|nr:methylenetetrahydrofolate--tRNA-(uracil(54)-C(5))-methyltransferase (FADH(2)-oxidizing) TrmFO [Acholeplasmataceae bacterium]